MLRSSFVLLLAVAACGGPSGATCPSDSTLTYDNFGSAFFTEYCLGCHSAERSGGRRSGAPEGVDFDTVADIREHAEAIDAEAAAGPDATNTGMPKGQPKPTAGERRRLGEWLACGAPE